MEKVWYNGSAKKFKHLEKLKIFCLKEVKSKFLTSFNAQKNKQILYIRRILMKTYKKLLPQINLSSTSQGYCLVHGLNYDKMVLRFQFPKTNVSIENAYLTIGTSQGYSSDYYVFESLNGSLDDNSNLCIGCGKTDENSNYTRIDLRKFYEQKKKAGKINDEMFIYINFVNGIIPIAGTECYFCVNYGRKYDYKGQKATLPFEIGNLRGYIDLSDRSLHYEKTLIQGYGRLPITLTQVFNSKKTYSDDIVFDDNTERKIYSNLGYGNRLNYNQYLVVDEGTTLKSDGESNVYFTWINGAGEQIHFRKNATTNYISCNENYKMKQVTTNEYSITDLSNNTYTFGPVGNLSYLCLKTITDKNGRTINLYYDNTTKLLTQIADENEQSITISYDDDNNLTTVQTGGAGLNNIVISVTMDGEPKVCKITTPENFSNINIEHSHYYDENDNDAYGVRAIYDETGIGYYFDITENGEYVGMHSLTKNNTGYSGDQTVTLNGEAYKIIKNYEITTNNNFVRVVDLINEKSKLYSFNYYGECSSVIDESYKGVVSGNGMAKQAVFNGKYLTTSFVSVDGWENYDNELGTDSAVTVFSDTEENKFAMLKYLENQKAGANNNVYVNATLSQKVIDKMKSINEDSTLLVSAWVKADALPFDRKIVKKTLQMTTAYYESNLLINAATANLKDNYNLCVKVTYSNNENETFKHSCDWQITAYQYSVVPVKLSMQKWQTVTKLEVYVETASTTSASLYGISAMAGDYQIEEKNYWGATKSVENSREDKLTAYTYDDDFNNYSDSSSENDPTFLLQSVTVLKDASSLPKFDSSVEYEYDGQNRVVSETVYKELKTTSEEAMNNGLKTTYEYNNIGDIVKTKKFCANLTNSSSEPLVIVNEMLYNQYGQPQSNINEFGQTTASFGYSRGAVNLVTSSLMSNVNYSYDVTRQFLKTVQSSCNDVSNLNVTTYSNGRTISERDGSTPLGDGNNEYSYEYDNFGRIAKIKVNGVEYCTFDYSNKNVQLMRYANGEEICSTYSPYDDSVVLFYHNYTTDYDGEECITWYNNNGRYINSSEGYDAHSVSYDALGRVSSSNNVNNNDDFYSISINNEYEKGDKLKSTTISHKTGANKYEIDKITNIEPTENEDYVKIYSHTAIGTETAEIDKLSRLIKTTKNTGVFEKNYEYKTVPNETNEDNTSNLISREIFKINSGVNSTLSYDYDALGRVIQVNEVNGGVSVAKIKYVYDGLGRLSQEQNAYADKSCIYNYDNAGNITLKVEYCYNEYSPFDDSDYIQTTEYIYQNGKLHSVVVGNDSELEQFNCAYDVIGNPSTYLGKTAVWSHGHRLDGYNGASFTYNSSGIRKSKTVGGVTTKYLLNGTDIVCQESSNGKTFKFYYGIDGVTAFDYQGYKYYYKKNIFGDIIGIYNNEGGFVAGYAYDAFGNFRFVDETGTETYNVPEVAQFNPFRYRSYYYDTETNLYYLNARYYDPQIGRFICPDSIEYLDPKTINGLNLYAYCGNDPVNKSDPSGYFPIAALLIGIGIGALFGGITAGVSSALDGNTGWALVGDILGGALIGGATGAAFTLGGLAGVGMIGTKAAIIGFGVSTVASFGAGVGANVLQSTFRGEAIDWDEAWQDGTYTAIQSAVCFWVGASMSNGGMWKSLNSKAYSSSISLFRSVGQNGLRSFANGSLLYLEMFGKDMMIRTGVKFLYTYLWSYLRNNN